MASSRSSSTTSRSTPSSAATWRRPAPRRTARRQGSPRLPGRPVQTWYHWGELWLASAVITIFGAAPLAARYFVVLPVVLLAAAALTGTVVRRMTGATSRPAFLFGFLACLFLAPVPLILRVRSSARGRSGMIFGITHLRAERGCGLACPVRPRGPRGTAGDVGPRRLRRERRRLHPAGPHRRRAPGARRLARSHG